MACSAHAVHMQCTCSAHTCTYALQVLFESLALRIAAQSAISLVLAPLAAAYAVTCAGRLQLGVRVVEAVFACVPPSLRPVVAIVCREGAMVAVLAAATVAVFVPFTISLVDEFYLLKATAKAKRALRAARSRALASQQHASLLKEFRK